MSNPSSYIPLAHRQKNINLNFSIAWEKKWQGLTV